MRTTMRLAIGAAMVAALATPAGALPVTSGLELWLDATDTATLYQDAGMTTPVTSAGQSVRGWADKSGNANDATTGGSAPTFQTGVIGGQDVVRFNRSQLTDGSGLNIAASQDRTAFLVMNYSTLTQNSELLGTSTGAMLDVGTWSSSERLRVRNGGTGLFSAPDSVPTGFHILQVGGGAGGTRAFRESIPIISSSTAAFDWAMNASFGIGGANFSGREYIGDLAEVVVYDRALTADEANAVGHALSRKYGLNTIYRRPGTESLRYTFDGLTGGAWPGTSLYGQDGWVNLNGSGLTVIANGAGNTWSLNESAYRPSGGDGQAVRPHSLDGLPGAIARMAFVCRARNNGSYMMSFGLQDTETGEVAFQFGLQNDQWFIREADYGTQHNVAAGLSSTSLGYLVVLEIDGTANGGDGLGSLSIQNLTDGSLLSPVAGLQNIPLGILDMDLGASASATWDALYLRMAGGGASMDNLFVEAMPEPGTLALLALGGLGLLRRRRRQTRP
jgi:hypothetical protein